MKRISKVKLARTAAAALVLVAATAVAAPGWGRERGREHARDDLGPAPQVMRTIGRELDLTRDQKRSLRELVRQHADDLRGAARDVGDARRALHEKVLADTPDEAAIRNASEKLGAAIGSTAVLTARLVGEIRPILTPAQRDLLQKVRSRWEERRERRQERIERWDGN